jgi:polysaccharide pyruvyl transferase WcaK-like protein
MSSRTGQTQGPAVLLAGYYGMRNTGDDALLAATAWGVRHYLSPRRIRATASRIPDIPGAQDIRSVLTPTPPMRGVNLLRTWFAALQSGQVIFGGGSVFHSVESLMRATWLLRLSGRGPHVAMGVAAGPFTSNKQERMCVKLLKRLHFVGVRDNRSYDFIRSVAPGVCCRRTFDLALLLPNLCEPDPLLPSGSPERRGLGLALCDCERFVGQDTAPEAIRRQRIKALLDQLDPEAVEELVLIDFNGHPVRGDAPIHAEIASHAARRFRVVHLPYQPNPLQVLRRIAGLRGLVAMRLHAAVFAYMTATPTVFLSYHRKCDDWAGEAGFPSGQLFDSVDFDPTAVARVLTAALGGSFQSPSLAVAEAQRLAAENWAWCARPDGSVGLVDAGRT